MRQDGPGGVPWVQAVELRLPAVQRAGLWVGLVVAGTLSLAFLGAASSVSRFGLALAWAFATTAPFIRALLISVRSSGRRLVIRNFLRTYRIDRTDIERVDAGRAPTRRERVIGARQSMPAVITQDGRRVVLTTAGFYERAMWPQWCVPIEEWLTRTAALGYASRPES
jgi:hypothetical protein